jgi:hypothetical protein
LKMDLAIVENRFGCCIKWILHMEEDVLVRITVCKVLTGGMKNPTLGYLLFQLRQ